jgi:nitrous oxidase accessory protein
MIKVSFYNILTFFLLLIPFMAGAEMLRVERGSLLYSIQDALRLSHDHDTIIVATGYYSEKNITITKSITLIGEEYPVLDGENRYEIISIKASGVTVRGFKLQNSGSGTLEDPAAIRIYNSGRVLISDNIIENSFFGIYIQFGTDCIVKNNRLKANGEAEHEIGNGIHCWKSSNLQITGNTISGHRDGIYFEFVTNSIIWRNISKGNIRYGLHFMFSNDDSYISNVFKNNGAGVAVMFTKNVRMFNNTFRENWGDGAYGLLLKEISDSYLSGNRFERNTSGIHMEGTNRISIDKNVFQSNGWAMKIQASCMDNVIKANNFIGNTFDIGTNGTLVLNTFYGNYWDKYDGYDLNKDRIGDVPYHPLSLFAVLVEQHPPAMILFRSLMVNLLDKSEKMIPSLTPDNFVDQTPLMHSLEL